MAKSPKPKKAKPKKSATDKPNKAWDSAKEEQHRIRRALILKAAAECLNERGYEGTSLSRIAKKLNMTNGALYYYFSGKMELAFECLMAAHLKTRECLEQAEDTGKTGLDMVGRFIIAISRANQEDRPWILSSPPYFFTPDLAMQAQEAANENVAHLAKIIKLGIEDGSIRACEPNATALLIFGSLILLSSSSPMGVTVSDEELSEIAKRYVSQSLAASPI